MSSNRFAENLIEILLKHKQLASSQLADFKARLANSEDFETAAKKIGISEEEVAKAQGEFFNLPYFDLFGKRINNDILNLIPKDLSFNYQVVPFEFDSKTNLLKVGIVDPGDFKAIEATEFLSRKNGFRVEYFVITSSAFKQTVKQYESLKTEVKKALDIVEDRYKQKKAEEAAEEKELDFDEVIKSAPVSKMMESILKHAVEGNASDIHIEPAEDSTRVRYRIDGVLHTSLKLPKHLHNSLITRLKVMSNLKIDETRIPQDGRIRVEVGGIKIDLRISFLPLFNAEKVVLRILDVSNKIITLEELGFWGRGLEILYDNIKKATGMFLVTGPTGSGKSTTLYAVLNLVNKEGVNILTLEDPIEYYLDGINQSQVNTEVGYTFAFGLRSALRQDPDIIMVGEVRDNETAELAIHAALTGHMVLSTLHTNDAIGAIPRLIDMHVEPFLLSSTLNVVIAQRLVRKICKFCKEEINDIPEKIIDHVKKIVVDIKPEHLPKELQDMIHKEEYHFYRGKGCPRCGDSGYQGRIAIVEILSMTDDLKKVLQNNKLDEIKRIFIEQGLPNMQQDGVMKVLQGHTTMEEVLRVAKE
jgi:type IV pilus assembly protein PilB